MGKTGYKVTDILSGAVDITSLSEKELRKATRTLADAGNKRIKRLQETGEPSLSPAYRQLQKRLGVDTDDIPKLTSNSADSRNTLLHKIVAMRDFMNAATSTKTGYKGYAEEIEKRIPGYGSLSEDAKKNMWRAYERLKDTKDIFAIGSKEVQQKAQSVTEEEMDVDNIYNKLLDEYDAMYEAQAEASSGWVPIADEDNPFLA